MKQGYHWCEETTLQIRQKMIGKKKYHQRHKPTNHLAICMENHEIFFRK
jgi:hypothetical protein